MEDDNTNNTDDTTGTGILGLGGTPISKSDDLNRSDDLDRSDDLGFPEGRSEIDSVHHRERERLRDIEDTTGTAVTERHSGATSIDMGYGGQGTDIKGR